MVKNFGFKNIALLTMLGASLLACEAKKNLDDMHDATLEMRDTTKDMSDTTKDMNTTTKDLRDTTQGMSKTTEEMSQTTQRMEQKTHELDAKTAELYDALRQGNAALSRKEFLDQMDRSQEMAKKLSFGVKYFWAYEFQLWSMQGLDNEERREELASAAAREFIMEVHEYAPTEDFISPTTNNNNEKNFLALATTLHEVNDKQRVRINSAGIKPMSMYLLIERALKQKAEMDAGKITVDQLAHSSYDLLGFEKKMFQILQARHNFILTMLVAKASHIDQSLLNKIKLGLFGMSWTLDLSKYNTVEMKEMKKYLGAIFETRDLLAKSGQPIVMDKTIMKIVRNGQVITSKTNIQSRNKIENEIISYIDKLKTDSIQLK